MSAEPLGSDDEQKSIHVEELRQSDEKFSLLVESIKDYAIFMLDPNGRIMTWNPGAEHIKGYSASEIIGKHFSIFYPPEDNEAHKPEYELEVAKKVGRFEDLGWRLRKDGTKFWANVIITAVYDKSGILRGFSKVTRDITEQKKAQEQALKQEQVFRLLVSGVKDYAIFMLDPDGHVVTWNEGAERNKGYKADEIIGKHISTFYSEEDIKARKPQLELAVAGREGRYEDIGWRLRKDGTRFWANVILTAIRDEQGELIGFAKVTRDLTERKIADDARDRATEKLAESNQELQHLAYVVSHELQEPISSISRYAGLLAVRYKGRLGADADEFMSCIVDSSKMIGRMVDDLWSYARVAKPNTEFTQCNCNLVFNDALVTLKQEVERHHAEITSGKLPYVRANQPVLTFLMTELIRNALKFRSEEVPRIHVEGKQESGGWLFSVQDNGIGIDTVHQQDVFRLFHRLKGRSDASGTGMGLAICRRIIEHHNGRIWFESGPGSSGQVVRIAQGTTFFFWLPIRPEEEQVSSATSVTHS